MKSTGIVRSIDNLGRIVIPMEIRKTLGIRNGDPIEIFKDESGIVLRKFNPISTLGEAFDQLKQQIDEQEDLKYKDSLLEKLFEIKSLINGEVKNDEL